MSQTILYDYDGTAPKKFVVPAGVTKFTNVNLYGARGGRVLPSSTYGGNPGFVWIGEMPVTPGETIYFDIGGVGADASGTHHGPGGFNGGGRGGVGSSPGSGGAGGGGATTMYRQILSGSTYIKKFIAIAAGSGGCTSGRVGGAGGASGTTGSGTGAGGGATTTTNGAAGGTGATAGVAMPTAIGTPTAVGGTGATYATAGINGGGGGGAGYRGGGGGAAGTSSTTPNNGAGGGGCNYLDTTAINTAQGSSNSSLNNAFVNGRVVFTFNSPPNAPTLVSPINSQYIAYDQANTFQWVPSDPDPNDTQSQANFRWRIGAGSWTETDAIATGDAARSFVSASGSWTAYNGQTIEWQMQTLDSTLLAGAWSASAFFRVAPTPTTPTITAPAANATVTATSTLVWTEAAAHKAYQVRRVADVAGVADTTNVYWDTGIINDAGNATHSVALSFPVNARSEHVQVRWQDATTGLWSNWADVKVTVAWTPPAVPTIAAVPNVGLGLVTIQVANSAGGGSVPNPVGNDVYMITAEGDVIQIADMIGINTAFNYYFATDGCKFYAVVHGDNGTTNTSATTAAITQGITGVWLCDPLLPSTSMVQFPYNDVGATEQFQVEAVTTHYSGRDYPVVDYGDAVDRTVTVTLTTLDTDATHLALRNFVKGKKTVVYRDKKGRRIFGFISVLPVQDGYGKKVSQITVTAIDYDESALMA